MFNFLKISAISFSFLALVNCVSFASTMDDLPTELKVKIVNKVDNQDSVKSLMLVNHEWRDIVLSRGVLRLAYSKLFSKACEEKDVSKEMHAQFLGNYVEKATPQPLLIKVFSFYEFSIFSNHMFTADVMLLTSRRFPNLQTFEMEGNPTITDDVVIQFANNCKSLERVLFSRCHLITATSIGHLTQTCPNIRHVAMIYCGNDGSFEYQHGDYLAREFPRIKFSYNINDYQQGDEIQEPEQEDI